ncbi:unnamed protein product [Hydatigera taeniaeformis]|uniref:Uncharacterized protein n=1 Tax=Hydatigena taeniaeformis TaxID=6205 RepID=A0A0R3WY92_HYDTA|nr:unnamed protein product [Hydatigera taeniaeformis]
MPSSPRPSSHPRLLEQHNSSVTTSKVVRKVCEELHPRFWYCGTVIVGSADVASAVTCHRCLTPSLSLSL